MSEQNQSKSPIESQLAAPPANYTPAPPIATGSSSSSELLQSRATVLAVLFLVTGVLGIPLLWINRKFSATERIVWTIIVTIYTLALIALAGWIVWWAYSRIVG